MHKSEVHLDYPDLTQLLIDNSGFTSQLVEPRYCTINLFDIVSRLLILFPDKCDSRYIGCDFKIGTSQGP